MKNAKIILLTLLLVFNMIGCSNHRTEQSKSPDKQFIEDFSKAINKRWTAQENLDEKLREDEYNKKNAEILETELKTIEKSLANTEDKDLKETGSQYIEGARIQIEMFKTTDYELQYQYSEESEKLRKPALIKLVDEYGVKIDEEHLQTYKDFKEQAIVINKENDANEYAEKIAQEITFDKSKGEFGDITYTAIVENASDIEFESIHYNVQYKDKDGVVIGNDYIFLQNFNPNTKQRVELAYTPEETETIRISLDYFSLEEGM